MHRSIKMLDSVAFTQQRRCCLTFMPFNICMAQICADNIFVFDENTTLMLAELII